MLPRLLILSLFVPSCVATVAAQSSPDKAPSSPLPSFTLPSAPLPSFTLRSSPLPQNGLVLPHDFQGLIPLFQNAPANQLQPLRQEQFQRRFNGLRSTTYLGLPQTGLAGNQAALAQNTAPCYAMRSYRFSREAPESDTTRLTDYSSCQPSTEFHIKNAVEMKSR